MLKMGEKVFLNLQEAVGWLLANNALPFQSTANYVADTEIAKSTIINPSPAEIKVGSLVLFADSKVGTVSGLTANGFMVGSEYTNIKDALAYISNIEINASGNLICTLSDGTSINAGKIKMVSNFSIDASQHLIANYNDGTSTDLGAIFSGNVNIAGNLTANSIIENMAGYSFGTPAMTNITFTKIYAGAVKNGNKLTLVFSGYVNIAAANPFGMAAVFVIPSAVLAKIIPVTIQGASALATDKKTVLKKSTSGSSSLEVFAVKGDGSLNFYLKDFDVGFELNTDYYLRYEITFLLSDSL